MYMYLVQCSAKELRERRGEETRRGVGLVTLLEVGAVCKLRPAGSLLCGYACHGSRQDQTEPLPLPFVKNPTPLPEHNLEEDIYT